MTAMLKLREVAMTRETRGDIDRMAGIEGTMQTEKENIATTEKRKGIMTEKTNGVVTTATMPGLVIETMAPGVSIEIRGIEKTAVMAETARDDIVAR